MSSNNRYKTNKQNEASLLLPTGPPWFPDVVFGILFRQDIIVENLPDFVCGCLVSTKSLGRLRSIFSTTEKIMIMILIKELES